jgi:hypothetical protein
MIDVIPIWIFRIHNEAEAPFNIISKYTPANPNTLRNH